MAAHDNARPHIKQCVREFFERRGIELLHQSPYSPDLNLCDRWLNNHIKSMVRGMQFDDESEVFEAVMNTLKNTDESVLRKQLDRLLVHCEKVIACGGGYVTLN